MERRYKMCALVLSMINSITRYLPVLFSRINDEVQELNNFDVLYFNHYKDVCVCVCVSV